MHELALCQAIVDTVDRRVEGRRAERVIVRIGHLRQVVPDSLQFSWEVLTAGTALDGCVLDVEHVPAVVESAACGSRTTLDLPVLACGACGTFDVELRCGEELVVVAIDVSQAVT